MKKFQVYFAHTYASYLCERCEKTKFDAFFKRYCVRHPSKYSKSDCAELPDEYKGYVHSKSTKIREFKGSMKVGVDIYKDVSSS